ncbi:uncharacterized protein LOC130962701, partial [Arachis stenosperma]|uniref:uncharacterized protein LOC130962701 n=2 Tax=Arachis stenosperma TaxID=217475 RepID=UPI0025AD2E95
MAAAMWATAEALGQQMSNHGNDGNGAQGPIEIRTSVVSVNKCGVAEEYVKKGDHVFLKVTPTTGVGRAIKAKKLNPRYIGPFQILERIGPVAYRMALPPHLSNLHDVFHVSQLRKYTPDASHVLEPESVQLREDLTLPVAPVRIDDTSIKRLRGKDVSLVKVAWSRGGVEEHTWELESEMRSDYPH